MERLEPLAVRAAAISAGALLVDIRSESQSASLTVLFQEAVFVGRNVLEWRCDPRLPPAATSGLQTSTVS